MGFYGCGLRVCKVQGCRVHSKRGLGTYCKAWDLIPHYEEWAIAEGQKGLRMHMNPNTRTP